MAVIQTVPSKAHYRTRAAAGGLRKHSPNVCIHWQQQALSSHDKSSALGFAPFAIRFTASRIAFWRQRGSSIRELQGIWSQRCRALCDWSSEPKLGGMRVIASMPNQVEYDFRQCDRRLKKRQLATSRRRACSSAPVRLAALRPPLQEERVLPITRRLR